MPSVGCLCVTVLACVGARCELHDRTQLCALVLFICFACSRQMGDIFDRGDDDLPIQEWVYKLAQEAGRANGALYSVMGNHEVLRPTGGGSAIGSHLALSYRPGL